MAPMRRWTSAAGHVLSEREWVRSNWWKLDAEGRLALNDGTTIEPRTFELVDPNGARSILGVANPSETGLDDYFYVTDVHHVRDDRLWSVLVEIRFVPPCGVRTGMERMLLDGLEPSRCETVT